MCIRDRYNTGDVSGRTAGGLAGTINFNANDNSSGDKTAYIQNVYSTGLVRSTDAADGAAGGLVGILDFYEKKPDGQSILKTYFQVENAFCLLYTSTGRPRYGNRRESAAG